MQKTTLLPILVLVLATLVHPALSVDEKFHYWFEKYESQFVHAVDVCHEQVHAYWTKNRTLCWSTCSCAADCILSTATETMKSNMASATVILGLMPSMIALLGPSVTELSLLSTRFPLLAFLLALASPGVNLTHLFRGPHLQESRVIGVPTSATMREFYWWYNQRSHFFKLSLRAVEFIVVGVMLANTITVSIDLDIRTVSGWRCGQMYMPLMWAVLSIGAHLPGFIAVRLRKSKLEHGHVMPNPPAALSMEPKTAFRIRSLIYRDDTSGWKQLVQGEDTRIGECLFWLASLLSIVHMLFGVLVFASLLFIAALDALPVVARYAVSVGICEGILLVELAGMRLDIATNV